MESILGEIRMFAGEFAPVGWAFCNGQLLSIAENDALFNLIGTTYGGDGMTTFGLPDLRGRVPVHQGKNPRTQTTFSIGAKGGTETVHLQTNQLPIHTHTVNVSSAEGTEIEPGQHVWAKRIVQFSQNPAAIQMSPGSVTFEGGNQPHSNMMPFTVISFIIATQGYYPPQS
ncbi:MULTISPECIES: phage tail protein [Brevibacillus]|uniref:Microcystin dependent MdpB family protein n=1 Tax=Brevibacillus parabrevis TaxID=54914 RepID=A0A4Y3PEM2_BREPA|nr:MULTISPECIES: tail fiber protein [Brevibacillus]MBU8714404.1 tail fiber protein [Brevibacillus parabrevis]MDH6351376.1 microcystin-dependent protein [Brevibacillus sp. 1238]MDR4998755.1 tail fiber protein [Brevibacillus parabrevis]MED2254888.1 tail fiber protein [Brevibacillus parabrevis]NRQ54447.1 phage tail protein [Brevibacillus sp. HD1.4A]